MCSYWAALSGIVLKLSDEEFEDMLLVYLRKTYKKDATATDVADYQELISDYGERESYFLTATKKNDIINELPELSDTFGLSNEQVEKFHDSVFSFDRYSDDQYSGGIIYPIKGLENNIFEDVAEDSYLLFSNKPAMSLEILSGRSYKTLDELVQDYKDTIGEYLPEDFDWESHIGFFQCAAYA